MAARTAPGGRRGHDGQRRDLTVTVRLSAAEKETLSAAAARAGLALSAYLGQAAMDAAENRAAPVSSVHRDLLAELIRASGLVRRAGTSLNQAAARLNAERAPGPDLIPAAAFVTRAARHVDEAALKISRSLP